MAAQRTIDIHAHILTEDMIHKMQAAAPALPLSLTEQGDEFGTLEVAGSVNRVFPRGGWDLDRRLKDMDENGVDVQLLSIVPQVFLYGQDADVGLKLAQLQNDAITALVEERPERFMGIAHIPMQSPELAAEELRRSVETLGLKGAMIASHVAGRNYDDPAFEIVWKTAADLNAFILIHPHRPAAGDRLKSYHLSNLIGNPLDTTIAAASLVFGGVLERYPSLVFCLSHGGGFVPYQSGRFSHGWKVRPEAKKFLDIPPDASVARFYYDTILHSKRQAEFLISDVGAAKVMLGSDYPFDMGALDCVRQVEELEIDPVDRDMVLGKGAEALLAAVSGGAGAKAGHALNHA